MWKHRGISDKVFSSFITVLISRKLGLNNNLSLMEWGSKVWSRIEVLESSVQMSPTHDDYLLHCRSCLLVFTSYFIHDQVHIEYRSFQNEILTDFLFQLHFTYSTRFAAPHVSKRHSGIEGRNPLPIHITAMPVQTRPNPKSKARMIKYLFSFFISDIQPNPLHMSTSTY